MINAKEHQEQGDAFGLKDFLRDVKNHSEVMPDQNMLEDLETILCDAICTEPVEYSAEETQDNKTEKYSKYDNGDYEPTKHEYIE